VPTIGLHHYQAGGWIYESETFVLLPLARVNQSRRGRWLFDTAGSVSRDGLGAVFQQCNLITF
jgi:hypothetical protein